MHRIVSYIQQQRGVNSEQNAGQMIQNTSVDHCRYLEDDRTWTRHDRAFILFDCRAVGGSLLIRLHTGWMRSTCGRSTIYSSHRAVGRNRSRWVSDGKHSPMHRGSKTSREMCQTWASTCPHRFTCQKKTRYHKSERLEREGVKPIGWRVWNSSCSKEWIVQMMKRSFTSTGD